jgi:hypothetical protein
MSLSLTDKSNSFNNNITLLDTSNLIIIEKNNLIYLALNLQIADLQLKNPRLKVHSFHNCRRLSIPTTRWRRHQMIKNSEPFILSSNNNLNNQFKVIRDII